MQRVPGGVEQVVAQEAAVDGQGAEHDAVHEHPADQGRGGALVEALDALVAQGLGYALERAREAGGIGCLEADLDGVEGVADFFLVKVGVSSYA